MKIVIDISDEDFAFITHFTILGLGMLKYRDIQVNILNAIKRGRVIPNDICSCWEDYPNKNHKHKNGKWKCVDCYINIDNAEGYKLKTHCKRVKTNERNIIPGNDTSEPEDKKEQSTDCLQQQNQTAFYYTERKI